MDTVSVFTAKDLKAAIRQGGCGNWKLNAERVRKCDYLVMIANAQHRESTHPKSQHGHAFLVGKISGLLSGADDDLNGKQGGRWIIEISEYADIDIPDAWGNYQNPVKYTSLSELGIRPERLAWKPFPADQATERTDSNIPALTIEEAKQGIAKKLRIDPSCIEITIRA